MRALNTYLSHEDRARVQQINSDVLGWSGLAQYGFFKAAFASGTINWLLMLGVYMGRDLAYILDILARYHPDLAVEITGVDKFNDTPCADWPAPILELWQKFAATPGSSAEREQVLDDMRTKFAGDAEATRAIQDLSERTTWKSAGFGEAPSADIAHRNLRDRIEGTRATVRLVKMQDEEFLNTISPGFDLVYIDTDHTQNTVERQIGQVRSRALMNPGGLLCGDDYLAINGWGVIEAVDKLLPERVIIDGCIWVTETGT